MQNNFDIEISWIRLDSLYAQWKLTLIGNSVGGLFVVLYSLSGMDQAFMFSWYALVLLLNIIRAGNAIIYRKLRQNEPRHNLNYVFWYWLFQFSLLIHLVVWVSPVFFPYAHNREAFTLMNTVVQVGLVSGGLLAYSASRLSMFIYLVTVLLVNAYAHSLIASELTHFVPYMILAYMVVMLGVMKRANNTFYENVRIRLENEHLSLFDPLTELGNRRKMEMFYQQLVARAERHDEVFSMLLLDLDHFKQYNDQKGHSLGDQRLRDIARILHESIRQEDMAIRFGGEEFIVLFPHTNANQALQMAERILKTIEDKTGSTISGGISEYQRGVPFDEQLHEADERLYKAKAAGRNRVIAQ